MGRRKQGDSHVEYLNLFDLSWQNDDESKVSPLPSVEKQRKEDFSDVVPNGIFGPWTKEISIEDLQKKLECGEITQDEFNAYKDPLKNKHPETKGYVFVGRKNGVFHYQLNYSESKMREFFETYFHWGKDKQDEMLKKIAPEYYANKNDSPVRAAEKRGLMSRTIEIIAERRWEKPEKIANRLFFEYQQYRLLALAHVIELSCHKDKDAPESSKRMWGENFASALQNYNIYFLGNVNPIKEFLGEINSLHDDAIASMRYLIRQDSCGNPLYLVADMAKICKQPEHEGDIGRKIVESGEARPKAFYIIDARDKSRTK